MQPPVCHTVLQLTASCLSHCLSHCPAAHPAKTDLSMSVSVSNNRVLMHWAPADASLGAGCLTYSMQHPHSCSPRKDLSLSYGPEVEI